MKMAYDLFAAPPSVADSPVILCFRELCDRMAAGSPADEAQLDHMAGWLTAKVEEYDFLPPGLEPLLPLWEAIREGWALMLEGVLCLPSDREEARELAEEGEALLQQLEQAIRDGREDLPVTYGYLE